MCSNSGDAQRKRKYICNSIQVNYSVTEHLSTQGKLDPRGGLRSFCVPTKLEQLLLAHLVH
jgi:hypothetical protein